METRILSEEQVYAFREELIREEKSCATVEKYLRDIQAFRCFLMDAPVTKEKMVAYKEQLQEKGYAVRSVNSMLASLNSLLTFLGWQDCRVRSLKLQQQIYCPEEKELSKGEYLRLLHSARRNPKLSLVMQTICSTGIRVSELRHFTVEAVSRGEVTVRCKGKTRDILLPRKLRKMLLSYAASEKIQEGVIFRSETGTALSRGSIWAQMKQLCKQAGVPPEKVFPHNLRKLFARTFYSIEKDIAKLADILGHSSINTTRIYIISTGREHRQKIERLGLLI